MKFETHAVLSTVTGRLMGDIGGVYKVTSFLIGRDAYTHELVFYGRKARDVLKNAMPDLPTEEDFEHVNETNVHDVRAEWEAKLGTQIEVPDYLRDCLADERNPVATMREMAPDKPIIAIIKE